MELVYEYEGKPQKLFLIRHKPSDLWWGPNQCGYTSSQLTAGTYSEAEALSIERKRGTGEDEAIALDEAVKQLGAVNPVVVAALSRGGR